MNRVLTEVYDAFIAAGTPEDKARSAITGDIVCLAKYLVMHN